jgi:acetoin utilization deacetylase AcuC-like enzyme
MTSETKYAVMIDLGEIHCGYKSGSGFCPVMGGDERSGNE